MEALERFADRVAYWTGIGVMVLVAAFTLLVCVSVFLRYGLSQGLDWSEEAGRYLMIWMGFLGASLALRNGAHVGVTMLRDALPTPIRRVVLLVGTVVVFGFFAMVTYQGILLLGMVSSKESLVLPISMLWPYLAIPVGTLLMLIQLVPVAMREWRTGAGLHVSEAEERLT
jgi:TRAP-type C4-dicarboxylate transport system permease small subunit